MSTSDPKVGGVVWIDLTVEDADSVRDFYSGVVGWEPVPQSMGEYNDYSMKAPAGGDVVAGICHARGVNAKVPPKWLPYFMVANVQASADRCLSLGGKLIDGPRPMGEHQFCVIQDPAGAVAALVGD